MAQTKKDIQSLLETAGSRPRHRFGQNFMIDQNLVRLIAAAGQIKAGDVVIEVGPGTGTLTEELLASPAGQVIAVEIDRDLAGMLRSRFASEPRFVLIEADALQSKSALNGELLAVVQAAQSPARLVANLPYNIASPLVIELLIAGVASAAFTVQKEVAERLRAGADEEHYGPLSVMAQLLGEVRLLRTLSAGAFWPAPKIESALVEIIRNDQLGQDARPFGAFLHGVFAYRRKTLRKALAQGGFDPTLASGVGIDDTDRPERVSPALWLAMYRLHVSRNASVA